MSLLRCTLRRKNRLPNLYSVDKVALRIDREFPQPQAGCKDSSRRSETATVSHAACRLVMKPEQEAVPFDLGSKPQLVKEENQRKRPAPIVFVTQEPQRTPLRIPKSYEVKELRKFPCHSGQVSLMPSWKTKEKDIPLSRVPTVNRMSAKANATRGPCGISTIPFLGGA
jgi:hypothetical protein